MTGELDRYLFGEGTHQQAHEVLGARVRVHEGVTGVHFAVWAPSARAVSVVGDFNAWDARAHPMRTSGVSGIWERFVPALLPGARYKFAITTPDGTVVLKADPYAREAEVPPRTASVVSHPPAHPWSDAAWMAARPAAVESAGRPLAIYEVHLGSWRRGEGGRWLTYRELARELVPYVQSMGFTHIELMPVMEHPFNGSWGYQVTGFFAPTSRFGTPDDFRFLVDACHQAGLGVILDWVPGHFPRDAHGLARFDGTALYEHADPRQGEHQDWGTLIFNYGRHEVRSFLLSNARYWVEQFHLDGLRVDAVASMLYLDYSRREGEWVPNRYGGRENLDAVAFLQDLSRTLEATYPAVMLIAEESTAWPGVTRPVHLGGLGFTYKWNMGWMHDMLAYGREDPVHRKWHHDKVTFSMLYAFSERFVLPFSHDEVVHGKRSMLDKLPGDPWQKRATLRALYGYMYGHPGKKLLFMGGEFGQWREWDHDQSLDWHLLDDPAHAGLQQWVRDLNRAYAALPALWRVDHAPEGFEWIDCHDHEQSVVSFARHGVGRDAPVVVVVNFTPVVRHGYRVGLPQGGPWREVLNSDAPIYGGSGVGNGGAVRSEPVPWHGQGDSAALTVPPLGCLMLTPQSA